jgi:hypothetical protein
VAVLWDETQWLCSGVILGGPVGKMCEELRESRLIVEAVPEAEMNPTGLRVHKWWVIRAVAVLAATVLADGLTAWYVPRPIFWCALIAASLPASLVVFLVVPMLRQEKQKA